MKTRHRADFAGPRDTRGPGEPVRGEPGWTGVGARRPRGHGRPERTPCPSGPRRPTAGTRPRSARARAPAAARTRRPRRGQTHVHTAWPGPRGAGRGPTGGRGARGPRALLPARWRSRQEGRGGAAAPALQGPARGLPAAVPERKPTCQSSSPGARDASPPLGGALKTFSLLMENRRRARGRGSLDLDRQPGKGPSRASPGHRPPVRACRRPPMRACRRPRV